MVSLAICFQGCYEDSTFHPVSTAVVMLRAWVSGGPGSPTPSPVFRPVPVVLGHLMLCSLVRPWLSL